MPPPNNHEWKQAWSDLLRRIKLWLTLKKLEFKYEPEKPWVKWTERIYFRSLWSLAFLYIGISLILVVVLKATDFYALYIKFVLFLEYKHADLVIKVVGGILGGSLAIVALFIAGSRARSLFKQTEIGQDQLNTEFYRSIVQQLGATTEVKEMQDGQAAVLTKPNIAQRLGGLYGLEKLMQNSPEEYHSIGVNLLSAYLHEEAPKMKKVVEKVIGIEMTKFIPPSDLPEEQIDKPRVDVQTALTILWRRERLKQ